MIIYLIQSEASTVLNDIIDSKIYTKEGQKTVELSVEDFSDLRLSLQKIATDEGLKRLNNYIKAQYIDP